MGRSTCVVRKGIIAESEGGHGQQMGQSMVVEAGARQHSVRLPTKSLGVLHQPARNPTRR
jgi:hypothetical protein